MKKVAKKDIYTSRIVPRLTTRNMRKKYKINKVTKREKRSTIPVSPRKVAKLLEPVDYEMILDDTEATSEPEEEITVEEIRFEDQRVLKTYKTSATAPSHPDVDDKIFIESLLPILDEMTVKQKRIFRQAMMKLMAKKKT